MNVFKDFEAKIQDALNQMVQAGELPSGLDFSRITVEPPRDPSHGDVSTNAAMVLAKPAGKPPRAIADALVARLKDAATVTDASVAGPGFVNLRIDTGFWLSRMADILNLGAGFGSSKLGEGKPVNVEYVSANPTGPMHVGHTRGAVVGDALARLLIKTGFKVTQEYYINDAGAQVDVLARSAYLRYREAFGETIEIPAGLYPGDYLVPVGQALKDQYGDKFLNADEAEWLPLFREFAVAQMMVRIKEDLAQMGVKHDVFSSERAIVDAGAVELALKTLEDQGLIYTGVLEPPKGKKPDDWEPRPQTLFRASQFGDDVDRPLKKSDGSYTYFANDIAYHFDKFRRGGGDLIDVLGADHGGYVKRMQAAVTAITGGKGALDVKICQLVNLMDDGQPVKMSKRAGRFVTLRDIVDEVGAGVVRFIMLTRRNDQTLDFDVAKVTEQSKENPVFYVQYAHARCHSVLRHAADAGADLSSAGLAAANLSRLSSEEEVAIVKQMLSFPRLVEAAAEAHEPHRVAFYLYELASSFHGLWNKGKDDASMRFLIEGDADLTRARLALVTAVAQVIACGLDILGVEPVKEMR
ncbi:arginine--tRNA ligase [Niveispirillum cyanobacteriorum]|uniref:Arginine--tRNA ligase n=1 Tax=Niveispirillum cyanobacteriorum TaxID=1612173 RepID=A0A2K9N946_9PROT|nr:arginine--tRNA ligase [Niveispirillum cyanobacteriorum]AUN29599.1 arginine--tRNA ligase [Niveispirillum cyanobacteriorum]GGE62813.1 arginine--tRNA ligase [Niveispirillum cyanobacteriorum]